MSHQTRVEMESRKSPHQAVPVFQPKNGQGTCRPRLVYSTAILFEESSTCDTVFHMQRPLKRVTVEALHSVP